MYSDNNKTFTTRFFKLTQMSAWPRFGGKCQSVLYLSQLSVFTFECSRREKEKEDELLTDTDGERPSVLCLDMGSFSFSLSERLLRLLNVILHRHIHPHAHTQRMKWSYLKESQEVIIQFLFFKCKRILSKELPQPLQLRNVTWF